MGTRESFVLFTFLVFSFHANVLSSKKPTCNSNDSEALKAFHEGLESVIDGWRTSDCCSWVGVICESLLVSSNVSSNRVVGLELGRKGLRGSSDGSLAGLDQLRSLNLSHNYLYGSIPPELLHFIHLKVLDLSDNDFTGSIPSYTDLPSVKFLDVSQNSLHGIIDTGACKRLSHIQVLNFSMNYFSGNFPSGFGNCTSLQHLILNSNRLMGSLSEDLFSLQELRHLHLQDNCLSGPLSSRISNLSKLVVLDLSLNGFSGILPNVFASLRKLESLTAHSNNFTGPLPKSLWDAPKIQLLNLSNNSLNGTIHVNCTKMLDLRSLSLSSNLFHGRIPVSLSFCRELRTVNLGRNHLTGQIPETFINLQALSELSISYNRIHNISSALGILQQCKNLRILVLTLNFQAEEMPANENIQFKTLKALIIPNCGLIGSIPRWLSSCTKLQLLDLSWNHLGGQIPDFFSRLVFLFYIDFSNNSLSGGIPKSLTKLKSLINQSISFEDPSFEFSVFKSLSARSLQYKRISSFPPMLDLSLNRLSGQIWPEFGNLKNLHVFDLKRNNLFGRIPNELSGMKNLEILDLSHNNLSGMIPLSLTDLSFLSKLDVSYNRLEGKVPSTGQFMTFPCSSFIGNQDLTSSFCILHPISPETPPLSTNKKKSRVEIIGVPFIIGIPFGFVLAVIISFKAGWLFPKKKGRRRTQNKRSHIIKRANLIRQMQNN